MVKPGKKFENKLMDALERWVGDEGVPMFQKQSWSTRRGKFQMEQKCDVVVDSPHGIYYIGIEAKTLDVTNSKGKYGFYFSQIDVSQFQKQRRYAKQSGRHLAVAVEGRNYGPQRSDTAWLVPLSLFIEKEARGDSKVGWDDIAQYGYRLGTDGEYEICDEAIQHVARLDMEMEDNPSFFDSQYDTPINGSPDGNSTTSPE